MENKTTPRVSELTETKAIVLRNEVAIILGCQDGRSAEEKAEAVISWIAKHGSPEAPVSEHNKQFTPMEARGTLVYLGRSGGFDVRDCPDAVSLAQFIVTSCNAAATTASAKVLTAAAKVIRAWRYSPVNTKDDWLRDQMGELIRAHDAAVAADLRAARTKRSKEGS